MITTPGTPGRRSVLRSAVAGLGAAVVTTATSACAPGDQEPPRPRESQPALTLPWAPPVPDKTDGSCSPTSHAPGRTTTTAAAQTWTSAIPRSLPA